MCLFPFPALVFPKNREIPGNSREIIFGNSQTGTTLITIEKQTLKAFMSSFWSYLSVILSDYYTVPVKKAFERHLTCSWLISCTVLLAAFSGQLRDLVIKGKAIYWIDNLEDLYNWKHVTKLHMLVLTDISNFIHNQNETDPMARDFSQRHIEEYIVTTGMRIEDTIDFEAVKRGTAALVYPAHYLQIFKNMMASDRFREDIDFHVSNNGGYSTPLFTATNRAILDENYSLIWDKV